MKDITEKVFLECEKKRTFWLMIMVAGWYGSYTFVERGGVFCNAQTANVVLFGMAIGQRDWPKALYLMVPIGAYFLGAMFSEVLGKSIKRLGILRWDTVLVGIEIVACILLGLLPAKAPDQICQVALNFLCSMQFNTFRQAEGTPAATTFVTNHIRQVGSNLVKLIRPHENEAAKNRVILHGSLLLCFLAGAILCAFLCEYFGYYTIWGAGIILLIVFVRLAWVDTHTEKGMLDQVPRGH